MGKSWDRLWALLCIPLLSVGQYVGKSDPLKGLAWDVFSYVCFCFVLFLFLATLRGLQDLISLTRD